jgi:colicin import membrane protein
MSTKSCQQITPPCGRQTARVDLHGAQAEAPSSIAAGSPYGRHRAGPLRECGTWRAFGLSVTLHAALLASLVSGMHWPRDTPAAAGTAVTVAAGRIDASPIDAPAPRINDRPPTSPVMTLAARPGGGNEHTAIEPHHSGAAKPRRAHGEASLTAHSARARQTHMTVVREIEQPSGRSADPEREARLAALQSLAATPASGPGAPRTSAGAEVSPGYAEIVARRVRANVVAPFAIQGNPSVVIAVTCAPNGALLSATVRRSSGDPQWDRAALTAVESSDPMPRDVDGTTPAKFLITFQASG